MRSATRVVHRTLFSTANGRPTGQRGFYGYARIGADSVNDAAFTMLNVT